VSPRQLRTLLKLGAGVAGVILLLALLGRLGGRDRPPAAIHLRPAIDMVALEAEVDTFCGDCHVVPQPKHFPKDGWFWLVNKGYQLYFDSTRDDLKMPLMHEVVEYYRRQAPTTLTMPTYDESGPAPSTRFVRTVPELGVKPTPLHAVSYIQWLPVEVGGDPRLIFSDMRGGGLYFAPYGSPITTQLQFDNPAHLEPCDLDEDGIRDFLVADLGGFPAEDHLRGRVMWARGNGHGFDPPVTLQDGIGRVADVREGDFDGDGDPDLVVAEFGWRTTGSIFLLLNRKTPAGELKLEKQAVDRRHGTIHVPPVDLDGDGRLDFVALISQEYEAVEAFMNVGNKPGKEGVQFERRIIFEAETPAYGCSGIQLVDLDRDGDIDVLLTNGDVIDTEKIRPYQGVQWLENTGSFPFVHHFLTVLPGVHRALAGDLDGDGDLDIAAVALLPEFILATEDRDKLQSVIWLEQSAPGEFRRHALESRDCYHASLELGDFDGDSDLDLAVGNFLFERDDPSIPWMSIWLNQKVGNGTTTADRAPRP
jgi:hypothetical protein